MNKYLQITLNSPFILLFFISFNLNAGELADKVSTCTTALSKGDLVRAISVSSDILKAEPNNYDGLLCKGRALGAQGNYSEALSTLELAVNNSQSGLEQIISYIFIGNLQKNSNKNAEAIASYEKSLKICELEKNDKFKRINLNFIGETHAKNNDLNAALASYLAGSKLAMNDNERADSFERLAAIYSALEQHDSAIEYQLKATLMQQKAGTLDEYANASFVLGQTYEKAKEYNHAENTYLKLLKFSKDNGGAYYEAKANYALGQLKAIAGDSANARILMADALKVAKSAGENDLAVEIDASLKKLNN